MPTETDRKWSSSSATTYKETGNICQVTFFMRVLASNSALFLFSSADHSSSCDGQAPCSQAARAAELERQRAAIVDALEIFCTSEFRDAWMMDKDLFVPLWLLWSLQAAPNKRTGVFRFWH